MAISRAQMGSQMKGNKMKKPVQKKKGGGNLLNWLSPAAAIANSVKSGKAEGLMQLSPIAQMAAAANKGRAAPAPTGDAPAPAAPSAPAAAPAPAPRRAKSAAPLMRNSMMKSGGKVTKKAAGGKVTKKAAGGKMGGRGDGCAMRGKTKGRMC